MNLDLRYTNIPDEALNAARTLRNHGIMQGWGGITRDKPWSIEGMGPTTVLQDRINSLELQLSKTQQENATLRRINVETSREASVQATKLHEATAELKRIGESHDSLQSTLSLRYDADQRAIRRWQDANNEPLTWPDHVDLVTWMDEQNQQLRKDRDNEAARADQLKKDYDDAREQHWKSLEHFRNAEENTRLAICALGLSPAHHPTLNDAIRGARELTQALRNDLANPPADIQEAVLAKLGIMDGTCQLEGDKDGRITITAATDIFPVNKACLQRLVDQHNKGLDLEQAIAEIRAIVNPKQPNDGTP